MCIFSTKTGKKVFFFIQLFLLIRGCHCVDAAQLMLLHNDLFSTLFLSHQILLYPPSLHPEIFSLGLPLFHFSTSNFISIILLPTYSWYLLMTCLNHLSLSSLIFIFNRSILTVPLMYLFLILSFFVNPITNLNIFFSPTSISSICFFVTQVHTPLLFYHRTVHFSFYSS